MLNFKELMCGRTFMIPANQRPYSWEKENLEQFWYDIVNIPENNNHFMNSLIVKESDKMKIVSDKLETLVEYLVVDGQQRITTIVILIKVISDFMSNEGHKDHITGNYVKINNREDGTSCYKLELSGDLHNYFSALMSSYGGIKLEPNNISQKRLRYAYQYFFNRLNNAKSAFDGDFDDYLVDLLITLTERLEFSVFFANEGLNVGILFEVSNCRGRKLTNLDKIKNKFLYINDINGNELVKDKINVVWSNIYSLLMRYDLSGESNEDQFLHGLWQSINSELVGTKNNMYDELCSEFSSTDDVIDKLMMFLELVVPSLLIYCSIYNPFIEQAYEEAGDLQYELSELTIKLHRLGITGMFLPLFISSYNVHGYEGLKSVLIWAEIFSMRVFRIAEKKSNTGRNELFRIAGKLYKGHCTLDDVKFTFAGFLNKHCPIRGVYNFFKRKNYNFYEWKYVKYLLIEYDIHLQSSNNDNSYTIEPSDVTIEHILPRQYENDTYWIKQFETKSNCNKSINRLGNLTLSKRGWNASYGSKSFPKKKLTTPYGYMQSPYLIESGLCKYNNWNMETINNRQDMIAEWAKIRWSL